MTLEVAVKTDIEAELRALGLSTVLVEALLKGAGPEQAVPEVPVQGELPELKVARQLVVDLGPVPFGVTDQYVNCLSRAFEDYQRDREDLTPEEVKANFEAAKERCDLDYGVLK